MEYPEEYRPNHHRAKTNGYVDKHILVAEQLIGRNLKDAEYVHHKDRNKGNYSSNNLIVFVSNADHARYHKTGICVETEEHNVFVSPKMFRETCKHCGNPIGRNNTGRCRKCAEIASRKVERPSRDKLEILVRSNSMVSIAKMFGVSDNAIRKWCKQYGIQYKKANKNADMV